MRIHRQNASGREGLESEDEDEGTRESSDNEETDVGDSVRAEGEVGSERVGAGRESAAGSGEETATPHASASEPCAFSSPEGEESSEGEEEDGRVHSDVDQKSVCGIRVGQLVQSQRGARLG